MALDAAGKLLATTSADRGVRLWEAATGSTVAELEGHTATSWSPAFRPRGAELATLGSDGTVRVWSVSGRKELRRWEKTGNGMGAVAWSPDGVLLAAGTWTVERGRGVIGWLHVWDYAKNELLWKAEYGVKPITTLAFHPGGARFAAGTWDGWAGIFDARGEGKPLAKARFPFLEGTYPAMQAVAFAPDGKTLAAASKDGLIRIFDAETTAPVRELAGHTRWVNSLAYGSGWLASGSSDQTLRLWDASTSALLRVLHGHTASINAVVFAPAANRLITAAADGTLLWWDAGLASLSRELWSHPKDVYGFNFSADGEYAAAAA
jgi:WD40 repeat protein